jgi:hypothetical protein
MEPEQIQIMISTVVLVHSKTQTWPAMNEQERDGVFVVGFFMHKMNSLFPNRGRVLC